MDSTKKVHWVVENDVFEENGIRMQEAIRKSGADLHLCTYIEVLRDGRWTALPTEECVVCWGSISFIRTFKHPSYWGWSPGARWCEFKQFNCSQYFGYWGKYLLNQHYAILPFGELKRKKDYVFDLFGAVTLAKGTDEPEIFIRPDTSTKTFVGGLANRKEYDDIVKMDLLPHSLIIVSCPKKLVNEWRYVVADKKVLSGSRYRTRLSPQDDALSIVIDKEIHEPATALAQEIANTEWQPSPVYTLDMCQTEDGEYHLLELNSFNSADVYQCDAELIVREISRLAREEWERDQAAQREV